MGIFNGISIGNQIVVGANSNHGFANFGWIKNSKSYIIPIAFTKYVKRNGKVSQNHSGLYINKPTQAAAETRVISQ
jgi:hypothetical protein